MKKLIAILFIFLLQNSFATTYYVSSAGGDANNGTSTVTPWQTLNKVNSFTFSPGDNILFNRGENWTGSITISNSGSSGNPITFGAYGSGANPIITGFQPVGGWTNLGGNIWESSSAVSTLPTCNIVVIDGKNTPMGRYPNTGYLTYQSFSGNTSITSSSLTGSPNWAGADAAIKVNNWTVNRVTISSQSGGTLNFPAMSGNGAAGFGFFIENDARTLDTANEWYYNTGTKKIRVYSTTTPTNVQVPIVDTLFQTASGKSYISLNNINFIGANKAFIFCSNDHISITNCNFSFCGWDGITLNGVGNTISNNTLSDIGGNGIFLNYGNPGNSTISSNVFRRTNIITGVLANDYTAAPIRCYSSNTLIQYNDIDSSGYNGIQFKFNNVQVRNNLINHSALVRQDAGGIYTGFASETGKVIDGNIILNTVGNYDGTNGTGTLAHGIYIDDLGTGVTITNNTIANCGNTGIFLHNANNCFVRNNTVYNCGATPAVFTKGDLLFKHEAGMTPISKDTIRSNIFFSVGQGQSSIFVSDTATNVVTSYGTLDSNYYAKPLSLSSQDSLFSVNNGASTNYYNLGSWKTYTGMDSHSNVSPALASDSSKFKFIYNATTGSVILSLPANYIDVKGTTYNGTITLPAYGSAVLIFSSALNPVRIQFLKQPWKVNYHNIN